MNNDYNDNPFAHDESCLISQKRYTPLIAEDAQLYRKVKKTASIEQKVVEERAVRLFHKNEQIHSMSAAHLEELCPKPAEGEQWRIITEKSFNAYAFIISLLEEGISDLHLAIYRINEPTVKSLLAMLDDGRIEHATFIISSFFNQTKRPERWAQMLASYCEAHQSTTNFAYLHNHAKVCAVKTKKGECYVFEGSGNMSDNARIEQYTYEHSRLMYDFHCAWMDKLSKQNKS